MIPSQGWPSRIGVAVVVLLACAPRLNAQPEERRWLPDPVLLATIEDRDGTLFGNPQEIVALPDAAFALLDRGDNAVRAFLADGSPAWTFGRYGEGPGEFVFMQDIDVSPEGESTGSGQGSGANHNHRLDLPRFHGRLVLGVDSV